MIQLHPVVRVCQQGLPIKYQQNTMRDSSNTVNRIINQKSKILIQSLKLVIDLTPDQRQRQRKNIKIVTEENCQNRSWQEGSLLRKFGHNVQSQRQQSLVDHFGSPSRSIGNLNIKLSNLSSKNQYHSNQGQEGQTISRDQKSSGQKAKINKLFHSRKQYYSSYLKPGTKVYSRNQIKSLIINEKQLRHYLESSPQQKVLPKSQSVSLPQIRKMSLNYGESLVGQGLRLKEREQAKALECKTLERKANIRRKKINLFSDIPVGEVNIASIEQCKLKRNKVQTDYRISPWPIHTGGRS